MYVKINNKEVQLAEVGPRFEMRGRYFLLSYFRILNINIPFILVYEIKLGTVDLKDADTEWVLRPYQRTARKRDHL